MRTLSTGFIIGWLLLAVVGSVAAAEATNSTAAILPDWETMSNRWGAAAFDTIKQHAEAGDVSAQYYLAGWYFTENGATNDPVQALAWMKRAAQSGAARPESKLGWLLLHGVGTAPDDLEAFAWFKKSADQGDAHAQVNLGWMYQHGRGVTEDDATAVRYYRLAADQGYPEGESHLAWMYMYGDGVERNFELAKQWMHKALDLKSAKDQYELAKFLNSEFAPEGYQLTNDLAESIEWFRKAAEQGLAGAQFDLAQLYDTGRLGDAHRAECIPWYLKAAAQNYPDALAKIPMLKELYPGNPLLHSIDPLAAQKQAAASGVLSAQFDLALRYHLGDGVPKDPVEAFKWMSKAAEHDISPVTKTIDAHYYLGVMYETGEGVARNMTNAFKLYQAAAVGGNKPDPFVRLGQMYENGEGVAPDDRQAAENYLQGLQFGFFPTSDDTARTTGLEHLLGLYDQKRGLPGDPAEVGPQLDEIKRSPILSAKAQFLLGDIYDKGQVVPRDAVEAIVWIQLAAGQNWAGASQRLAQIEAAASDAQKSAAGKRFDDLNRSLNQALRSYEEAEGYRAATVW